MTDENAPAPERSPIEDMHENFDSLISDGLQYVSLVIAAAPKLTASPQAALLALLAASTIMHRVVEEMSHGKTDFAALATRVMAQSDKFVRFESIQLPPGLSNEAVGRIMKMMQDMANTNETPN